MARKKVAQSATRPTGKKRKPFDVVKFLVEGGRIDFHSGGFKRKVASVDTVIEEGVWDADAGTGITLDVPYRAVITLGTPRKRKEVAR